MDTNQKVKVASESEGTPWWEKPEKGEELNPDEQLATVAVSPAVNLGSGCHLFNSTAMSKNIQLDTVSAIVTILQGRRDQCTDEAALHPTGGGNYADWWDRADTIKECIDHIHKSYPAALDYITDKALNA